MHKPIYRLGLALIGLLLATANGAAQEWHIGTSLIGEPKYQAGFAHFDYVNPQAPKGGTVRLSATGSFDTFNPILPLGEAAIGLGLVYETLTTPSLDEVSTHYGLLAESYSYPADFSSVTFRMNSRARWHDGQPVTAEDVVWSFNKTIELNISRKNYFRNVTSAAVTAPGEVTFTFDQAGNRELPFIMGEVMVMPQHWWEGTGADGQKRDIGRSTLEVPLGSGPYRMTSFSPGASITYRRVPDYWAANEPTQIGTNNFDELRYDYFRDQTIAFEAFKGDQFDFWIEAIARRWATGYDFPAVADNRVLKELFENPFRASGISTAFFPNMRRPQFADQRVRRALNYAFDFEEINKTAFYGQYTRVDSLFYGYDLRWTGLPQGEELQILESLRDRVPETVFTTEYTNPVAGDPTKFRTNLREALRLLTEAGYRLEGRSLVDSQGQQFSVEILLRDPSFEILALPYTQTLRMIGINATVRTVDAAQYSSRVRNRDFDMIYEVIGQSLSPGNEQRDYWGSVSANENNSDNYAGISDPGVDALIDKIIFADDRDTLVAATKALDRVLMAHDYVVPLYTSRSARVARWNRFSHPEALPEYDIGFPDIWWWDTQKAAATGGR